MLSEHFLIDKTVFKAKAVWCFYATLFILLNRLKKHKSSMRYLLPPLTLVDLIPLSIHWKLP